MENVSDEWLINQKAITQKQGYCIIEITDYADPLSPSVTVISSLDKDNDIKKVVHKRSYDPVCIEMPSNNVTVELYNYNDKYIDFYRDYSGRTIEINIKYGFCLSVNETIPGGKFYVKSVELDAENIIKITASSSVELEDNVLSCAYNEVSDADTVIWENPFVAGSDGNVIEYEDMKAHNLQTVSYRELINQTSDAAGIEFSAGSGLLNESVVLPGGSEFKTNDMIAFLINSAQLNINVKRDGTVSIYNNPKFFYKNKIYRLNIMSRPSYSQTKKLKSIAVSAPEYSLTGEEITERFTDTQSGIKVSFYEFDYLTREVYQFSSSTTIVKITRKISGGKRGYEVEHQTGYPFSMGIKYKDLTGDERRTTINYSDYGEICDIANKIGAPSNTDRIKNYFSNRDLYDITMRGDPARDVGDYVFFETEKGVFKKALLISDELTFTGSFSEKATVRIIKTDFETIYTDTSEIQTELFKYTSDGKKDALSGYGDFRGTSGGRYL